MNATSGISRPYLFRSKQNLILFQDALEILNVGEIGSMIIEKARDGFSESEILDSICSVYEVEPTQARLDYREFTDSLLNQGVVIHSKATDSQVETADQWLS